MPKPIKQAVIDAPGKSMEDPYWALLRSVSLAASPADPIPLDDDTINKRNSIREKVKALKDIMKKEKVGDFSDIEYVIRVYDSIKLEGNWQEYFSESKQKDTMTRLNEIYKKYMKKETLDDDVIDPIGDVNDPIGIWVKNDQSSGYVPPPLYVDSGNTVSLTAVTVIDRSFE